MTLLSSQAVHPHGRGDNNPVRSQLATLNGSPPRAWGQSVLGMSGPIVCRFTPTGVGTIVRPRRAPPGAPVHPHGRGDNPSRHRAADDPHGSPPRAWGQSGRRDDGRHGNRFTPTGVGTILVVERQPAVAAVHPHGRGDNVRSRVMVRDVIGSPPRAWGQLRRDGLKGLIRRFTPTGVGTIATATATTTSPTVHPHGRGDNWG